MFIYPILQQLNKHTIASSRKFKLLCDKKPKNLSVAQRSYFLHLFMQTFKVYWCFAFDSFNMKGLKSWHLKLQQAMVICPMVTFHQLSIPSRSSQPSEKVRLLVQSLIRTILAKSPQWEIQSELSKSLRLPSKSMLVERK